jgi:tRNA-2-methylthio-N6-dimethylallyladenosine synthase
MKYHIWTAGCQMNVADSQRVASALEKLGYQATSRAETADVIVLNTCVVRQSAEDKAHGRLSSLRPLKKARPDLVINLMGCMVGVRGDEALRQHYPYVDVFSPPSNPAPLLEHLLQQTGRQLEEAETMARFESMDEGLVLPLAERGKLISAYVPVVYGAGWNAVVRLVKSSAKHVHWSLKACVKSPCWARLSIATVWTSMASD